jgi:hypothetical protein
MGFCSVVYAAIKICILGCLFNYSVSTVGDDDNIVTAITDMFTFGEIGFAVVLETIVLYCLFLNLNGVLYISMIYYLIVPVQFMTFHSGKL